MSSKRPQIEPISVLKKYQRKPEHYSPSMYAPPTLEYDELSNSSYLNVEENVEMQKIFRIPVDPSPVRSDSNKNLTGSTLHKKTPDSYFTKLRNIHYPVQKHFRYVLLLIFLAAFFAFTAFIKFYIVISIILCVLCCIFAWYAYLGYRTANRKTPGYSYTSEIETNDYQFIRPKLENPANKFIIDVESEKQSYNGMGGSGSTSMNLYRPYISADRAAASFARSQFALSSDTTIEQLATDSLTKLKITIPDFMKYIGNMKAFIARTMLSKLVLKLHSDDSLITNMISIPGFEGCKPYVISRLKSLSSSQFLAGHFGDRGDRWHDREWTNDLPSDNQIILHALSVWISVYMNGKKTGRSALLFKQRHVFIQREARCEGDDDILLCSDDWSKFYVMTRYKSSIVDRFWAFPGHDSLYAGLTIFFWFVKEKMNFLMEGADLCDVPFCMDRIYSQKRYE